MTTTVPNAKTKLSNLVKYCVLKTCGENSQNTDFMKEILKIIELNLRVNNLIL